MTNDIEVTKVLDFDIDGAYCTLLRYQNLRILIDCGFSREFQTQKYVENHELLRGVDIILITSSEIEFSGALCFLLNKYNHIVRSIGSYLLNCSREIPNEYKSFILFLATFRSQFNGKRTKD